MVYLSKLTKRLALAWSAGAALVILAACGETGVPSETDAPGPEAPTVASVRVLPESAHVRIGRTLQLAAEVRDNRGLAMQSEPVTWTSADTTIAVVSSTGVVTALKDGTTEIRGRARGIVGRTKITSDPLPVTSVAVTPTPASVTVGQQVTLTVSTLGEGGVVLTGRPVVWTSSNPVFATVDSAGRVSGVSAGSVTITATSEGVSGAAALTVTPVPLPGQVTDLSVSSIGDTTATLRFTEVGDGLGGAANYVVRYAVNTISWSTATAVTRGTCVSPVVGTTVGATRTCTIRGLAPSTAYRFQLVAVRGTVGSGSEVSGPLSNVASGTTAQVAVSSVALSPATASVAVGGTASFAATVRDAAGNVLTGRSISWSSANTAVATVSSTGVATGVSAGTATVRATSGGVTGTATLTVTAPTVVTVTSVTLTPTADTLDVGQTQTLAPTLRDANGNLVTGRTLTWSSTSTTVATVSSSGVVTARAAGTATIRGTVDGVTGSATVLVVAPPPAPVASVTIAPTAPATTVGSAVQLSATLRDAAGTVLSGRAVTWASASPSIVSVSASGAASGVAVGTATVSATSEGVSAQVTVSVAAAPPTPTLLFSSEWSSAVGSTSTALTDGGKWDNVYCGSASQTLSVIDGSTVGWTRTANVLRLRQMGESTCGMLEKVNSIPVSTTHWGRFYFRNDETSTTHNHVATYYPVGDIQVAIWNREGTASGVRLFLRTYKDASGNFAGWPYSYWQLTPTLSNGTWYRYEWHMEYVTATTYRLWPRVYDMSGTLIADADDYRDSNGGRTLAQHYASGATFGVSASLARNVGIGNEGPAGSANTGGFWYHARFALSSSGWIGQ